MSSKRTKNREQGLTLLGVIFAIGIALVGLMGILSLLRYVIVVGRISSDRFIAVNLAQEGMEMVRAIRDNNWQADPPGQWDNGLSTGVFTVQYNQDALTRCTDNNPDACSALEINANGFYTYGGGGTKYSRRIYIYNDNAPPPGPGEPSPCPDDPLADETDGVDTICVFSEVVWQALGRTYAAVVADRLYNWQ